MYSGEIDIAMIVEVDFWFWRHGRLKREVLTSRHRDE